MLEDKSDNSSSHKFKKVVSVFILCRHANDFFYEAYFLQVLIPTKVYSGQKLITDVARKTPPNTSNTVPHVPVTVPVKNRAENTIAKITRIIRSVFPMFVFI